MNTEEFIKRATEKHSGKYTYEKSVYVNPETKVIITCKKHGDFEQTPFAHLSGQGCPKCAGRGLSQNEIIERFRSVHGDKYDYSKVVFTRMRDKVCIICPKHGEFWQTPDKHYKQGQGCPSCGNIKKNQGRKTSIDAFIRNAKAVHGDKYDYSKVSFNTMHDKVTIICPEHGEFNQLAYDHLGGHGCTKCAIEKSRLTKDDFVRRANDIHNGKYDYSKSDVQNSFDKLTIICPIHGEFKQNAGTHLKGCGCPACGKIESVAERELYGYICSLVGKDNVIHNDRTVLNGKEIDIYVPSKKIGFEYNGVVWHSEKFGKDKNYHLEKLNEANKNGIRLVQIFEDEFSNHKELVFAKIKRLLGCCSDLKRIYARDCYVTEIDTELAKRFLNRCHIQGFAKSTVYLGLKRRDDCYPLVAVMTFTKNGDGRWNLTRYAADKDMIVCGGGGKLFKYFVRNYPVNNIVTFADRRWTVSEDDNLYTKIGFKLDKVTNPDYRYIFGSDGIRYHKFNFRKKALSKKYSLPIEMTESEMTASIGAYRIWDCGLYRYIWAKR